MIAIIPGFFCPFPFFRSIFSGIPSFVNWPEVERNPDHGLNKIIPDGILPSGISHPDYGLPEASPDESSASNFPGQQAAILANPLETPEDD